MLSQRTTLKAVGVNGTASRSDQIAKPRGKTYARKLDKNGLPDEHLANGFQVLSRARELRFLPPAGGIVVAGYTAAQVITSGGDSPRQTRPSLAAPAPATCPLRPQARMRAPAPGTGASLRKLSRRQSTGQNPPRVAEAFASLRPKKEPACAGSCRELSP